MHYPVGKPIYCRREAYALFAAQLPRLETLPGLVNAAVAISMHQLHDADPDYVEAELEHLARSIRSRVRGDNRSALLAHAHHVLFDEQRFAGNSEDYYNPLNSYLPSVLETKRGLPIALSLVYKCVMERLGVPVTGINAPLHFIVSVEIDPRRCASMLVDPYEGGRELTRAEAIHRIEAATGQPILGSDAMLEPANNRAWLTRMLNNLINIFSATDRRIDLAAMTELRSLLEAR